METTLIKNGIVLTNDKDFRIINNGAIVVQGNKILDVGKTDDVEKKHKADVVIDAKRKMLVPGFVDVHMHTNVVRSSSATIYSDIAKGLGKVHDVFDEVRRLTTPESGKAEALNGYSEAIRSGITTVLDFVRQAEAKGKAAEEIGIRARVVPMIYDVFDPPPWSETLEDTIRLVKQTYDKPDLRVKFWPGFDGTEDCSTESIEKIVEDAKKFPDLDMHTHSNEFMREVTYCNGKFGMDPIEYLDSIGYTGPNVIIAHCVHVSGKEINILEKTGTRVAYQSVCNSRTGTGIAPVPEYLSRGIPVGIGTDNMMGAPVNMLEAMRVAIYTQRAMRKDTRALTNRQAFDLATMGGARAMRLDKEIGSLEPGKKADIVIFNLRRQHFTPTILTDRTNLVTQLVIMATERDVESVMIDGNMVLENQEFKTIDEDKVIEDAAAHAFDLMKRSPEILLHHKRIV
jgi:5-methylthioadenosine/S-adenosylhomocysteine deaminase